MTISNLMKMVESSPNSRKHWRKRRNCSSRAISPFPTEFSKDLYYRCLKTRVYLENGLLILNFKFYIDYSKLREFADDNFEFDENGRKFSKQVENTAGKGEIARHEQFLLFSQCFQKTCTADT